VFSFVVQCHWLEQMVIEMFFGVVFGFMLERSCVFFSCAMSLVIAIVRCHQLQHMAKVCC
jgi:hypothetical protein